MCLPSFYQAAAGRKTERRLLEGRRQHGSGAGPQGLPKVCEWLPWLAPGVRKLGISVRLGAAGSSQSKHCPTAYLPIVGEAKPGSIPQVGEGYLGDG